MLGKASTCVTNAAYCIMSQASTSKSKDNGKKYTSFNLNQTYKGSKGENKSAAGKIYS